MEKCYKYKYVNQLWFTYFTYFGFQCCKSHKTLPVVPCWTSQGLLYKFILQTDNHSHQRGQQLPWQHPGPVCWWCMSPSWHAGQLPVHAAGHWRQEPHWCLLLLTHSPPQSGPNCQRWPDECHLGEAGQRRDREAYTVYSWVRSIKAVAKLPSGVRPTCRVFTTSVKLTSTILSLGPCGAWPTADVEELLPDLLQHCVVHTWMKHDNTRYVTLMYI